MLDELKSLLPLQEIDKKIFEIKSLIDEIPPKIEKIENLIKEKKDEIACLSKEYEKLVLQHKEKEIEMGKCEETVNSLQARLYQVKTNKEYSALQEEIASLKSKISGLEDEILALLEELDSAQEKKRQAQMDIEKEISDMEKSKAELIAEQERLKKEMDSLQEKRKTIASEIPQDILSIYERILEHRGGVALCKVTSKGVCTGCYLSLPPQVVSELMLGNKIIYCEGCGSILYYVEE